MQTTNSIPPIIKIFYFVISLLPMAAIGETDITDDIEKITTAGTMSFYLENDLFSETDQNYTNGIRISWESQDLSSYENSPRLPPWIRKANDQLSFFHDLKQGLQRNLVVSFGQLMFTPKDIYAKQVIENDRPYAGYLYLGFAYHTRSNDQLDTLEVNFGIVGPASQADHTQDLVHEIRGFDKFEGWQNQLSNEPTFQLIF
jgi:lipid A 3-O-deacylase